MKGKKKSLIKLKRKKAPNKEFVGMTDPQVLGASLYPRQLKKFKEQPPH